MLFGASSFPSKWEDFMQPRTHYINVLYSDIILYFKKAINETLLYTLKKLMYDKNLCKDQ